MLLYLGVFLTPCSDVAWQAELEVQAEQLLREQKAREAADKESEGLRVEIKHAVGKITTLESQLTEANSALDKALNLDKDQAQRDRENELKRAAHLAKMEQERLEDEATKLKSDMAGPEAEGYPGTSN